MTVSSLQVAPADQPDLKGLVLFDVDGTMLVGTLDAHYQAFVDAFRQTVGINLTFESSGPVAKIDGQIVNGMTDTQCADMFLSRDRTEKHPPELRLPLFDAMAVRYEELINDGASPGTVLPGVVETLQTLQGAGMALAVLTGGIEAVARRRLDATGLGSFFPTGAFGDNGVDRAALFAPALATANEHYGRDFTQAAVYVGDTLRDVDAARQANVKSAAVATGHCTEKELSDAGADLVLRNLEGDSADLLIQLLKGSSQ